MDINKLKEECEKILKYLKDKCKEFPNGCCAYSSHLLAYVLKNVYKYECVLIISGCLKNSNYSHKWVWVNGYIVDLTISQFNNKGYNFPEIYINECCDEYNNKFDYLGGILYSTSEFNNENKPIKSIIKEYCDLNYTDNNYIAINFDTKNQDLGD